MKPIVSVFMLTYNQEKFIAQAIESVLMQETDFDYELVIGEDCSSDNTGNICSQYQAKFSDIIKLKSHSNNIGLIRNFVDTYKRCKGKYVAILDGDDYWIDCQKLQKQKDFLDEHTDCKICFTSVLNLFSDGQLIKRRWPDRKETETFDDLIFKNSVPSVSAFFRKDDAALPPWIVDFPYGDWPLYLWILKGGGAVKFLDETTGVYRREIGVSEKIRLVPSEIAKVNLKIVESVLNDSNYQHKIGIISKSVLKHRFALMACYFREGKFLRSLTIAFHLFRDQPVKVFKIYMYLVKRKFM